MSLLNVIKPGTYSTVRLGLYDKKAKAIQIEVRIYSNSTKKKLLTTLMHDLAMEHDNIIDHPLMSSPPVSAVLGDTCFVTGPASGGWEGFEGSIMSFHHWDGADQWGQIEYGTIMHSTPEEINPVYFTALGGYYSVSEDWVMTPTRPGGLQLWNEFFDPALHEAAGENLIKSVYAYLKSLPEYANAIDG